MSAPRRHLGAGAALSVAITYEVSRRRWPIGRVLKSSYRLAFVLGLVGILGGLGFFLLTHHSIFAAIATSEPRAKAVGRSG